VHILKQFRPHSNYDQAFCRVGAANFIFFLKLELISAAKKLFIERSSCLDFYVFIAAVDTNEEQTDTSVFDSFFSEKIYNFFFLFFVRDERNRVEARFQNFFPTSQCKTASTAKLTRTPFLKRL